MLRRTGPVWSVSAPVWSVSTLAQRRAGPGWRRQNPVLRRSNLVWRRAGPVLRRPGLVLRRSGPSAFEHLQRGFRAAQPGKCPFSGRWCPKVSQGDQTTWPDCGTGRRASVLECGDPPLLSERVAYCHISQSAGGLAHSRTLREVGRVVTPGAGTGALRGRDHRNAMTRPPGSAGVSPASWPADTRRQDAGAPGASRNDPAFVPYGGGRVLLGKIIVFCLFRKFITVRFTF